MIAAALYAACMVWLWQRRRFLVFFMAFLFLAWTWRIVDVLYIDKTGPLLAIELFRDIGGGNATTWLVAMYLTVLACVVFVFRPSMIRQTADAQQPNTPESVAAARRTATIVFSLFVAFVASLYLDMAHNGVIPALSGMERWVYTAQYGGPTHQILYKYGMHLSFYLGLFYWYPLLRGEAPDNRFLGLLLSILLYLFLAGNRFSAFYSHSMFFMIPAAVPQLMRWRERDKGIAAAAEPRKKATVGWGVRILQAATALVVVALILVALYRSFFVVRFVGQDLAKFGIQQRTLVQEGEMFVASYDRIVQQDRSNTALAYHKIFEDPVGLPGRNSSMPFLMELELGGETAGPIIAEGVSYAGGYPEIFWELFGKWWVFAGIAVFAIIMALLSRLLIRLVLEGRILSVFFTFYVLWPFYGVHGAGMLNFLGWKYFLKIAAFAIWIMFEELYRMPRQVLQEATA